MGIDHNVKKGARSPTIKIDLTDESGQSILWDILLQPGAIGCHCAPPCGTASLAREINKQNPTNPQPLRDKRYPDGYPWLVGRDKRRVVAANKLYSLCFRIFVFCNTHGLLFSIENSAKSLFWHTSHWSNLARSQHPRFHTFLRHCMFGSKRKKHTQLCHNYHQLSQLGVLCNNAHTHAQWGRSSTGWRTAEETAYPGPLCKAWARCILQTALDAGALSGPQSIGDLEADVYNLRHSQVGGNKQPRGRRIPPLVPEFKSVAVLTGPSKAHPSVSELKSGCILNPQLTAVPATSSLPDEGCKLLRTQFLGGEAGRSSGKMTGGGTMSESAVGIPWSCEEFLELAAGLQHPKNF